MQLKINVHLLNLLKFPKDLTDDNLTYKLWERIFKSNHSTKYKTSSWLLLSIVPSKTIINKNQYSHLKFIIFNIIY